MYSYYVDEAHRNLVLGNVEEAIENLELAVKSMDYLDADVVNQLGFLYFETGQIHRAKSIFKKVSNIKPDSVESYYGLGGIAEEEGNYNRALDYYNLALKIDKNHEYSNFNVAGIYADHFDNHHLAIKHYKNVININKLNFWAYMNLGNVYEKINKNKEAYKYFLKAYDLEPFNSKALFNLGVASAKLGNYDDAITWYKESINAEDPYEFSYLNLALIYKDIKKDDNKALEVYTDGITIYPENAILIYNRACNNAILGNMEAAKADLIKSIILDESLKEYCLTDSELSLVILELDVQKHL